MQSQGSWIINEVSLLLSVLVVLESYYGRYRFDFDAINA